MDKRKAFGMAVLIAGILVKAASPLIAAGSSTSSGNASYVDTGPEVAGRIDAALASGPRMVEAATAVLEKGWGGMSPDEKSLFMKYFDPSGTGEIDEEFIRVVLDNYRKIHRRYEGDLTIIYETQNGMCRGTRLYYTDFLRIHLCPYVQREPNPERLARDLMHELAHISLLVVDRAYFSSTDPRYQSLTPRGHWTADLPIVGRLLREIARADTLYHPDAYSRYAWAVAGS